jgi:myo-inositol-1(or 4)-monophosphatase
MLQFHHIDRHVSVQVDVDPAGIDDQDIRAAGRFEGFWEQRLSAWDIAAGVLLIREAGGIVTNYEGREIGVEHTGVVAGNPRMHAWLLETLGASA